MLFSTPTQFAVLALLLIAGWLFGLASHPGGRKWKERYAAERDAHATVRKQANDTVKARDARIAELERENARLAKAVPVAAAPVAAPVAHPSAAPAYVPTGTVTTRAVPADGARRGWFDWGNRAPLGR